MVSSDIKINILKVFDFSFSVRENLIDPSKENVRFHIEHKVGFNVTSNLMNLTVRIFYTYPDATDKILMDIWVENVFAIENMGEYVISKDSGVNESDMNLPSDVLIKVSEMSVSHARALLAKNKANSVFHETNLPYIDSYKIAKQFFRDKIKDV